MKKANQIKWVDEKSIEEETLKKSLFEFCSCKIDFQDAIEKE